MIRSFNVPDWGQTGGDYASVIDHASLGWTSRPLTAIEIPFLNTSGGMAQGIGHRLDFAAVRPVQAASELGPLGERARSFREDRDGRIGLNV